MRPGQGAGSPPEAEGPRGRPKLTAAVLWWGVRGRVGERGGEMGALGGAGAEGDGVSSGDSRDARGRFLLGTPAQKCHNDGR